MFETVIASIGGAIVGGVVNGVATSKANKIKIDAYKNAAKDIKTATEEYSGKKGLEKQLTEAKDYAYDYGTAVGNEYASQQFTPQGPGTTAGGINTAAYQNAQQAGNATASAAQSGASQGMSNAAAMNAAKYNQAVAAADLALKQAGIESGVARQSAQEGLNAASGALGVSNQILPTSSNRKVNGKRGHIVAPKTESNPYME